MSVQTVSEFLDSLTHKQVITPAHAQACLKRWREIAEIVGEVQPPMISLRDGPVIKFAWHGERYYLDISIRRRGDLEWFFSDKRTDEMSGTNDTTITEISDALRAAVGKAALECESKPVSA